MAAITGHPNPYCSFCGVVILPDHDHEWHVPRNRRPWYAEARGIYMSYGLHGHVTLTGVGLVRGRNDLWAPPESEDSYVNVEELDRWILFQNLDSVPAFGFHDSCWQLLRARLASGENKNEDYLLDSIWSQLYNTPCRNFSRLDFGHDYRGASSTLETIMPPGSVDLESPLYADPLSIPSLDILESIEPPNFELQSLKLVQKDSNGPEMLNCGALGNISLELLYEIISYLSCAEVTNLRLVCRRLSCVLRIDQLPQSYWKSRFLQGQEFDFLFPDTSTPGRNWFRIYRATARSKNLSMINRKSVRDLLEPIAALAEVDTSWRETPCGSIVSIEDKRNSIQPFLDYCEEDFPMTLEISRSHYAWIVCAGNEDLLQNGCRILDNLAIPFPLQQLKDGCQVIVSGLQLGVWKLLSGITFIPPQGVDPSIDQLGHCWAPTVGEVEIPPGSEIEALEVAFCSLGLIGLKFICKDNSSFEWVGENQGTGVACGVLPVSECPEEYFLMVGVDDWKIVTLGFGTPTSSDRAVSANLSRAPEMKGFEMFELGFGTSTSSNRAASMNPSRLPDHPILSRLWTPTMPSYKDLILSPLIPDLNLGIWEPLTNIDFGGPGGLLLGLLSRVVVCVVSYKHPIVGMGFFYTDGRVRTFGRTGLIELSFCIDGPGGERITELGDVHQGIHQGMKSSLGGGQIWIGTNTGRSADFSNIRRRAKGLNIRAFPSVQEGHAITGFVGSKKEPMDGFIRLGFQSQPFQEARTSLPPGQGYESQPAPEDCLRYDEQFADCFIGTEMLNNYQTYAPLRGVRKISASIGISGRSRSPDRISGLRFEYHEQRNPSILGQWMEENDAFELTPNERVSRLTTWVTKEDMSRNHPGVRQGQVEAIQIDTSHARTVTFCPPAARDCLHDCLLHQYQASEDEELVGVSWVLNSQYDRVRGVMEAKPHRRTFKLVPQLPPAFNQVQKVPFEIKRGQCDSDRLAVIVAYIQDDEIFGLKFVYESGEAVAVGEFLEDEDHHIIQLPKCSQIVGLSSVIECYTMKELEFLIEVSGTGNETEIQHLRLPCSPSHPLESHPNYHRRNTWCRDRTTASKIETSRWNDRTHLPPDKSRLAGIYFSCQDFTRVGAIYASVSKE